MTDILHKTDQEPGAMDRRKRLLLLVISLGLVLFLGLILVPRILAYSHQARAAGLLDEAVRFANDNRLIAVNCSQDPIENPNSLNQLERATAELKETMRLNPEASQAYLLLGRTYCHMGMPGKAVEAYQEYIRRRPENPLGHLELGFALEAECRLASFKAGQSLCPVSQQERFIDEWRQAGVVAGQFLEEGNRSFARQEYADAARWYRRGSIFGGNLPQKIMFKWSVASVLDGEPLPETSGASIVSTHTITETTRIEGEDLYWLMEQTASQPNYGDRLSKFPGNETTVGMMWWKGASGTFVRVPERGTYLIVLRVKDTPPGPLKVQIERNLVPIDQFVLSSADGMWKEIEAATILPAGIHLIGIRFLEDTGDLNIDWIRFDKIDRP